MLCDQLMLGAQEAGHTVEKIFLRNKRIAYCTGCLSCSTKTVGKCVIKDDAAELLEKMVEADVFVMGTPVYFYSMNAQLKTLIDRASPKYTEIKDKKAYLIATAADEDESAIDGTVTAFHGFLSCHTNVEDAGHVFGNGVNHVGDILGHPAAMKAYEMGKNI